MATPPTIKGHRILALLGEGGMGRVYLAEDEALGRKTAIKIVSERFPTGDRARARFLREARAMATVEHPNVVRVYAFGESEGAAYIVMEFVEGEALSARLARDGRLSLPEALRIVGQVVAALEAAWDKQLVHRDIKPSNVLLGRKGEVRVADFGLAKPLRTAALDADASLTAAGSLLGTPHYVSPEQAKDAPVDFRSDIYSLGIVLYELLLGQRPYEGRTPVEIVARHLHEPLPSLAEKRPDLPEAAVRLVEWMTAKDPAARPASYAELRTRIRAIEDGGLRTEAETAARAAAPLRFRRPALAAAITLAVVFGSGWVRKWFLPAAAPPRDSRMIVAVTPFYGPDESSAREGRVMAALVERAIAQRLPRSEVKVLGVEDTLQPARDHAAARALGERLGARLVVWGEAFVVRGESEIQPYVTLVPRASATQDQRGAALERDPALLERSAGSLLVGDQAVNQIELRKTGAGGVGDLVLVLAGVQALHAEGDAQKALLLLSQAPRTPETLRHRAEALLQLKKPDDARRELEAATALDAKDAQAWGDLGDLHLEAGRSQEALASYRRASETGVAYATRGGALQDGLLYSKETYLGRSTPIEESGFLLGTDPRTGVVRERHRYAGALRSIRVTRDGLELSCDEGLTGFRVVLSRGRIEAPVSLGSRLLHRRRGIDAGHALAFNFLPTPPDESEFKPRQRRPGLPQTLPELESALRAARQRDPTQPWHLFFLGQSEWWQGRRPEAAATWREMFSGAYPAMPYYHHAWMAGMFEQLSQPEWADRAFEKALDGRNRLRQPVGMPTFLIERLVNSPITHPLRARWKASPPSTAEADRGHLWLERLRALGPTEWDEFAAAAWADYYDARGEAAKAEAERAVRDRLKRAQPNSFQQIARADYALQAHTAATLSFWTALLVLLLAARRRGPTRSERHALLVAGVVVAASFFGLAQEGSKVAAQTALPIGIADAADSPYTLRELERRLAGRPSDPLRYAAAVSNHLAGNLERAQELYQSLPQSPRARRNLEALRAGSLVPPEPLRGEDFVEGFFESHGPPIVFLASTLGTRDSLSGWRNAFAAATVLNLCALGALGAAVAFVPIRHGAPAAASARAAGFVDRLPGIADLDQGRAWRGLVALTLAWFAVVAVSFHAYASAIAKLPATGPLTAAIMPSAAFLMPSAPFWPLFWTYADAPYYWTGVVMAAATSLGLQFTRRNRENAADHDAGDTRTRT